jgi:Flp pilus assembly CpaF family ATPase
MLNILSGFIPEGERVITIEDTCELLVHKRLEHVVRFEGRQANAEGAGEITLDDHLKAALRKRPDRIIIGECRGSEAYTMLEAMNTGHEGSMTTIHANNPTAALSRLITLVKQGESTLSEETIKAKIADAIDIIVQVNRFPDGTRKVVSIEQVGAYSDGVIQHDTLWEFVREGIDSNKNVVGEHQSKNIQPTALKNKIEEAGVVYDQNWFIDQHFPVNK